MLRDEENYVALFIDWDNLAISTSVDFGGAVPDVRAIVRSAQRFGTVVLARAYAEWNVSSDRLSVYRAGIEPVYAPTFRFEPEPGSQMPRGKSLADPCLVTDSIDIMHLMPNINVFVLVSGDKDLIPIVRLAQLRGKKVVVIGPDFVAAILREMADEYIPYRGLVEGPDATPVPEVTSGRSSRRMSGASRSHQLPPASSASARQAATSVAAPTRPAPAPSRSTPLEQNGNEPLEVPVAVTAAPVEPAAPARPTVEEAADTAPLFETIGNILREREQSGKPRLRATNLKDQLLARVPGFNEQKYGFARFKDLLAAAEKAGVLTVSRTGPVQWVAAVHGASQAAPAAPAPAAPPAEPAAATPPAETPSEESVDEDVVRFILDLRDRSRWLTYTYLLTNLLNHLGHGVADASADTAARATLNRLVQSGVLIVDKEPREIDVNGTKHRVRLCHIVDEHPLVARLREQARPAEEATPAEAAATELTPSVAPAAEPEATLEAGSPAEPVPQPAETPAAAAPGEPEATIAEAPAAEAPAAEPAAAPAAGAPEAPAGESEPAVVTSPPSEDAAGVASDVAAGSEADVAAKPAATSAEEAPPAAERAPENGAQPGPALTLTDSYAILRDVVREATGPNRPYTGPAAVKNRLVRRLGSFDEHQFGFSKFKDYLLAAERAGAVKVELVGNSARVSLPESPEGEARAEVNRA